MKFGMFYEHQLPQPWSEESEHRLLQDALAQVELGEDIPEALYRAVAEVLIFILRASGKIK